MIFSAELIGLLEDPVCDEACAEENVGGHCQGEDYQPQGGEPKFGACHKEDHASGDGAQQVQLCSEREQVCVFCTESRKHVMVFCRQKQSSDCEGGHDTGYNKEPFSVSEAGQGKSLQSGANDHRAA